VSFFFDSVSIWEGNTEGGFTVILQALSSHYTEVIGLSIKTLEGIREGLVQTKLRIDISVIALDLTSLVATIFEACPDKDPLEVVHLAYRAPRPSWLKKVPKSLKVQPSNTGILSMLEANIKWMESFLQGLDDEEQYILSLHGTLSVAPSLEDIYAALLFASDKHERRLLFDQGLAIICSKMQRSYRRLKWRDIH
jgi:hypothetical protein